MERIENPINREYLLNMRTVNRIDMIGWKVHALVAAIHIAAYNGNSGVVRLQCQEYGVDVNSTSETLEEEPMKDINAICELMAVKHGDLELDMFSSSVFGCFY